jgi:glycosyltransferase involved in cell wall biosynthesis
MNSLSLSICIPTYNRANLLGECLQSLCCVAQQYRNQIEVVISDNASTDETRLIVSRYQEKLPIRYFRNLENIGPERNIMAAAQHASAPHVWIFGDDDVFEKDAIPSVLHQIALGFDLIVLNFSAWSPDMSTMRRSTYMPFAHSRVFKNAQAVMVSLGAQLGYISCVVIRKDALLSIVPEEYEPFIQYGFSHLYAIYAGLSACCKAVYVAEPLFKNREDNSTVFLGDDKIQVWIKYFIYGTAVVFDALREKGYSRAAIVGGKEEVLRDFAVHAIFAGLGEIDRSTVLRRTWRTYLWNWRYWAFCVPGLLLPRRFLRIARGIYLALRRGLKPSSAVIQREQLGRP